MSEDKTCRAEFEAWWRERQEASWANRLGEPCPPDWGNGYKRSTFDGWQTAWSRAAKAAVPESPVVAKITVSGNSWHMDYLSLPEGTHNLYLRGLYLAAPTPPRDSKGGKNEL